MESSGYHGDRFAVFAGHEDLEEDPTRYLGWARSGRSVSGLADSRTGLAAQEMSQEGSDVISVLATVVSDKG